MAPSKDVEARKKLLESLKKEVKQLMEEAVTRKFIHADSSSITSLCAAVEAGISHGLKKRGPAGLLPAYDTQTLLSKLAKISEPAQELVHLLSGDEGEGEKTESKSFPGSGDSPTKMSVNNNRKINGYNISGHCGKYLWIRIAILEKLLIKILVDLKENASQFYEPEALMKDPGDGQIFIELLEGPCTLDFSKMKTPDSYWTDPSADELVQRHKIHSGLCNQMDSPPTTQRPRLGTSDPARDERQMVAPFLAREHVESLHQNSCATLLYGKNNVSVQPEDHQPIAGYLSLHKSPETLLLKWTPNTLMSGSCEKEKSEYWDKAVTVDLNNVVYIHCHQQEGSGGKVVLIGQDGVQRQPLSFPTAGSLLSFLNCLENGLYPNGQLDPPLFAPRSKGVGLPKLKRKRIGSESSAPVSPTKEVETQDYVFRLVSGTRTEDVAKEMEKLSLKRALSLRSGSTSIRRDTDKFQRTASFKRGPRQGIPPTRECLHTACETMRQRIKLRAFNGWLNYILHMKTVRTHLSSLVSEETVYPDGKQEDHCRGVTADMWQRLHANGMVKDEGQVRVYTYFGGVEHSIRKEVWPYLLGHYKFGSSAQEREELDLNSSEEYSGILKEWKAVEEWILRAEREHEADGVSLDSTGSRDEVMEQLEMINSSLHNGGTVGDRSDFIEEPEYDPRIIESYGHRADERQEQFVNGSSEQNGNGEDAESGCCDCGEESSRFSSSTLTCKRCGKKVVMDTSENGTHLSNGHTVERQLSKSSIGSEGEAHTLCKRCSRSESLDSRMSDPCPYKTELLENFGLNLHRIDKDVQRCDRNYHFFTQKNLEKLRNVISSYVWTTLDVGYVQGMCDLVAPLLVIFEDEALTFRCFIELMKRMDNNFPHGRAMDSHFANMRSLIKVLDPEMFDHLQQNGDLTHFYFCYRWFLLDFKRELKYEDVFMVWETIWAASASEHFVLFIALALLQFYRDIILDNKMDFTDIIKFFNEMAERHDAKAVLKAARSLVSKVQELVRNQ